MTAFPELHQAFERIRAASRAEPWADWDRRADRLRRLRALLRDGEAELCAAIDADFGHRAALETRVLDLTPSLLAVADALRHGRRWMRPRRVAPSALFPGAQARILPQPLGVVGIIAPWNYPVFLSVAPLAAAFAAGNRAMLKLSETTPRFGATLAALAGERFAPDELAIFHGARDEAAAFAALPFDHVLFTGSTAVGREVMAAAAANLVPVTLELGGKSPAVITPGYDLDRAATRIVHGKLANAGQTCVAPDHCHVPREALEPFIAACVRAARRLYPDGLGSADYCSIVAPRQHARLGAARDQAVAAGVRRVSLFDGPQDDAAAHRLAPALFVDPPPELDLMRDEIFGPWLPLLPYDDLDAALARIAAAPRPLALYWFDDDRERTAAALRVTHAGGVTVNDTLMHVAHGGLPLGGIGPSGMGHYHGRWGFDTFSKLKPVLHQPRWTTAALLRPPFGAGAARMLALLRRLA